MSDARQIPSEMYVSPPPARLQECLSALSVGPPAQPTVANVLVPENVCLWLGEGGYICGASLPPDPQLVSVHFRDDHALRGDRKEETPCLWLNCGSRPIQHRNMVRHILSVHLGLLRWTCPGCSRVFSRRGTSHRCQPDGDV